MIGRRSLAPIALTLAALLLASACGGSSDAGSASGGASTPSSASGSFPVTIDHKYGSSTIDAEPTRVVSVGYTDQDFLLALDVVPVGIRDWYGDQPYGTWPWAQDELGDATPELLSGPELNFEAIAAMQPDLIVGVSSGMSDDEYETLSAIAPTLAQPAEFVDYGTPWRDQLELIGQAVGQSDAAEATIAELDEQFAQIRADHPEFAGQEVAVSYALSETEVGAYGTQDVRGRLMADLGFEIPAEFDELAGDQFYSSFSLEQLDRLDRDVLLWVSATDAVNEQIEASPLRQQLAAVTEGREIFLDPELAAAAGFSSPLSLPHLLDALVPQLAAAVDGDPSTEIPAG